MSRDRDDKLQRAKDALKSALAALETEDTETNNNNNSTRSQNAVDRLRHDASDEFR